jgi:alkanesulfonate monooxygenase SsuD/methylene tetrahydromethanopterin reductase-like flavin-dependent oxidoreductase (luciferase family)
MSGPLATRVPLRLGWFLNFMPPAWRGVWRSPERSSWLDGRFYVDLARQFDTAGIDFLMLEDSAMVPDTFGGGLAAEFRYTTRAPKGDPVALLPYLAEATESIGLITTLSTTLYRPEHLAATIAALDAIAPGRVGWNVVTSAEDRAAQNIGLPALPEHDDRYAIAARFIDGVLAEWSRPEVGLTGARHPVIVEAGSSDAGRDLAARHAEIVLASQKGVDRMAAFRADIRARAERFGRDPDEIAVMFLVSPVIAETDDAARARADREYAPSDENVRRRLVHMSSGDIDFAALDWDAPIPETLTTNGIQSSLENLRRFAAGRTLREIAASRVESVPLVGTPDTVATQVEEIVDTVGGDGLLFFAGGGGVITRRYAAEITEGLLPALADRGLAAPRRADTGTLRDRLFGTTSTTSTSGASGASGAK